MAAATTISELNEQIDSKVYSVYSGMDEEYKALITEFHNVASQRGKFTQEHINEQKVSTAASVAALKSKYGELALNQLEALESDHTVTKNPTAEPLDTQGRLLYEIQRMNNMTLFNAKLQGADVDTLKELYDENKDDEDYLTLLTAHVKSVPEGDRILLEGYIRQSKENIFLTEINKVKYTFATLMNGDMYPAFADRGKGKIKFRSVNSDLSNVHLFREGWK